MRRLQHRGSPPGIPHFLVGLLLAMGMITAFPLEAQAPPPPEGFPPGEGEPFGQESDALDPESRRSGDDLVAGSFSDEITISILSVFARIVDPYGNLVPDVEVDDLRATIGGVDVPVIGVEFFDYEKSPGPPDFQNLPKEQGLSQEENETLLEFGELEVPSRQVIIVMQIGGHDVVTLEPSYVRGHQQSLPGMRELIDSLNPTDWLALFSYDAKLKLWQDFTRDHGEVKDRLFDTIGFATPPRAGPSKSEEGSPSLRRWIRPGRLEEANSPGESMLVLAEALKNIDGSKDIIYVGWDITGHHGIVSRLQRADAVVSVLDVTQASFHLLEGPLKTVVQATGGTYERLFRFPKRGPRRLARSVSGHHRITLDPEIAEGLEGSLQLAMPGRDIKIHMKAITF